MHLKYLIVLLISAVFSTQICLAQEDPASTCAGEGGDSGWHEGDVAGSGVGVVGGGVEARKAAVECNERIGQPATLRTFCIIHRKCRSLHASGRWISVDSGR